MKLVLDHELAAAFGDRLAPFAEVVVVRTTADVAAVEPAGVRALAIRTDQKIDAALAARFPGLEAIVTASAGRDHVRGVGVPVHDARGGNADGVADWVVLALAAQFGLGGPPPTVGVLGCGETGGRVLARLAARGVPTVAVDPPRARRDPSFVSAPVEALCACDVLTLHVPLTRRGLPDATEGWLDAERLAAWSRPVHVLSAARGEVIDEGALLAACALGRVASYRADVFCHEPRPHAATLAAARLVTPHVAGRSDDGRRGLQQRTLAALASLFGLAVEPLPDLAPVVLPAPDSATEVLAWLDAVTGFGRLDAALRADAESFAALRATHRRRDLRALVVSGGSEGVRRLVRSLGVSLEKS